jgi:hypothetical protein
MPVWESGIQFLVWIDVSEATDSHTFICIYLALAVFKIRKPQCKMRDGLASEQRHAANDSI